MSDTDPIDLAHVPNFAIGRLVVRPSVRQVARADGTSEVLEPRVMQVLVALARAQGAIVTRSELTESCWEGRIVGEDAINRVISRLRRAAEGIGAGAFRVETITKVGYRLIDLGAPMTEDGPAAFAPAVAPPSKDRAARAARPSRRALIGGGIGAAALVAGSGAWWALHRSPLNGPAQAAIDRGMAALGLGQMTVAAGAFHEAADLAPQAAEPWGLLAITYRQMYWTGHGNDAVANGMRAREAAGKALARDPSNGDAQAALATLKPLFSNWFDYSAGLKPIFDRNPDDPNIALLYIDLLSNVGHIREINRITQKFVARNDGWSNFCDDLMISSWCLGKIDDADAAHEQLMKLWPHQGWFTSLRYLAYSGRPAAAMAMLEDVDNRPTGIPAWNFDQNILEVRALLTRAPADIDKAAASFWEFGRTAAGMIANAVWFFAATGRLDDAFKALEALYFDRGMTLGEHEFSQEQGTYWPKRARPTWLLWLPMMGPLRADPQLAPLLREIRLADYWQRSGTRPDFPIAGI